MMAKEIPGSARLVDSREQVKKLVRISLALEEVIFFLCYMPQDKKKIIMLL